MFGTFIGSSHHESPIILRERHINRYVKRVRAIIKKLKLTNVTLAGAGMSGAILVPAVADKLKLPFVLLREPGARPRVGRTKFIGYMRDNVIFVDDIFDTGTTAKRLNNELINTGLKVELKAVVVDKFTWRKRPEFNSQGRTIPVFNLES
jgi:adenine/guanine phosphoribosyltransferase-like PRPP-binding protein